MAQKLQVLLSEEPTEIDMPDEVAIAEVIALGGGAYLVRAGHHVQEIYVSGQGTLSDGNKLDNVSITVLSSREALIRERFSSTLGNGKSAGLTGPVIVKAPMPGLVRSIKVAIGDMIEKDTTLLVLEAMKMENNISAAYRGVVKSIFVVPGTSVDKNARLIELERTEQ